LLIFDVGIRGERRAGLPYLLPVSIGVKSVVADHDLPLIGNMGSDSGYELQIVQMLFL